MSGFRLLGISVNKKCNSQFKKNLKHDYVFNFYSDYEIVLQKGLVKVNTSEAKVPDIYNISREVGEDLEINISALIGKNGSGKSSLIELFFLYVYLCNYKQILRHRISKEKDPFIVNLDDSYDTILENRESWFARSGSAREVHYFDEIEYFEKRDALLTVYYLWDSVVYQVNIDTRKKIVPNWFEVKYWNGSKFELATADNGKNQNPTPFYTIALNYSIHGLNNLELGEWINRIFHKNDGYQTPLVINPKRDEGIIDINNENDLQKSRLLANIIMCENEDQVRNIVFNDKSFFDIEFSFSDKTRLTFSKDRVISILELKSDGKHKREVKEDDEFYNAICDRFNLPNYSNLNQLEKLALRYIAHKLDKISRTYLREDGQKYDLDDIIEDRSHISFKIWQSVNFILGKSKLKEQLLKDIASSELEQDQDLHENFSNIRNIKISLDKLDDIVSILPGDTIEGVKLDELLIVYLPPPILDFNVHFSSDSSDNLNSMSSGEKQQMYTIHTIMYHIRNLASKEEDHSNKYRNINLILDEIELYFHPDFQRQYVSKLLLHIQNMQLSHLDIDSINILLATHSPFILSDLPKSNVLPLENGMTSKIDIPQTFAANIHEMLANSFFMDKGLIGDFSKNKLESLVAFLTNQGNAIEFTREESENIISLIGDEIIGARMRDLHREKFGLSLAEKQARRDLIIKELDILEKEINNDSNNEGKSS